MTFTAGAGGRRLRKWFSISSAAPTRLGEPRARASCFTALAASALTSAAHGADPEPAPTPEAALVHIDCANPRLDATALYESLALELQAQGVSLRPLDAFKSDDNFVLEVRTDCKTRQQLVLRAARGVQSSEVRFSLADVPHSSEPRTVALALAELLEDFRAHAEGDPAPLETPAKNAHPENATVDDSHAGTNKPALNSAVGPSLDLGPDVDNAFRGEPPVTIRDTPPDPPPDPGVHLMAHFGVEQRTFKLSTSLTGLNAGFSLGRAELGASLLRGDVVDAKDNTRTVVVGSVALGYRVAEVTNGRWTAAVMPRVGFGSLVVAVPSNAGTDGTQGSTSELYGDIAARVSVNARLWSRVGLTLNSEAGYGRGLVPIADGPSTSGYMGAFLGVALLGSLDFSSKKARLWPPVRDTAE